MMMMMAAKFFSAENGQLRGLPMAVIKAYGSHEPHVRLFIYARNPACFGGKIPFEYVFSFATPSYFCRESPPPPATPPHLTCSFHISTSKRPSSGSKLRSFGQKVMTWTRRHVLNFRGSPFNGTAAVTGVYQANGFVLCVCSRSSIDGTLSRHYSCRITLKGLSWEGGRNKVYGTTSPFIRDHPTMNTLLIEAIFQ